MNKCKSMLILVTMVITIVGMTGCVSTSKQGSNQEATKTSQPESSASMSVVEDKAASNSVVASIESAQLPTAEVEEVAEDGTVILKGDQYTRLIEYTLDDVIHNLPSIRGETVSMSEKGIDIYNSGVTMQIKVALKADTPPLSNVVNAQSSYSIDNDDITVVFDIDGEYCAVYTISMGANSDMVLYSKALEMFGIKLEESVK